MEIKDLLPIGSIVLLKGGKKRIMITGIKQTDAGSKPAKDYDYVGEMYPEGDIGSEYKIMFNHEDIDQIYFRGYEDIERQEFIKKLEAFYQKHPDGNQE